MTYLTERLCYRVNMSIVAAYGHMSNQSSWKCVFATSFSATFLIISLISQFTLFYRRGIDMPMFIDVVPITVVDTGCLIGLYGIYSNRKRLDKIYEILVYNLARNWSKEEIAVKKDFEEFSHFIINSFSLCAVLGTPTLFLTALIPPILDKILPINGTRERILPFGGDFYMDEEKYFYLILFIEFVITSCVAFFIAPIECMFVAVMYFICGMCAIIGYRLENILPKNENSGKMPDEEAMVNNIRQCMKDYQTVKECTSLINMCMDLLLPTLLIATALSFSITLVQVTNVELITPKSAVFGFAQITQFFLVSYVAQALLSCSSELRITVYNARWYDCPLKVKRMFMVVLLTIHKPCAVTLRTLLTLCIENFGAVTQTAISYFMVLRQMQ